MRRFYMPPKVFKPADVKTSYISSKNYKRKLLLCLLKGQKTI